jgi:TonB-dependent receptor
VSIQQGSVYGALMKHLSVYLLIAMVLPAYASGQGTVSGTVTDSTEGGTLVGANVFVVGTPYGAVTDYNGQFRIQGIPAGSQTLRVSYLGYRSNDVRLVITDGAAISVDVALVPSLIEGEEILITAQARGQVAAINQQLNANTIVNVVSEEKIQELPDANAAESIGRLPGVSVIRSGGEANKVVLRGLSEKFSTVTVDGIRIPPTDADSRGVDLSTISQGSLAGIELYKALTPDKDADAIAGSVNLVTKKAPSERFVRLDARGNYNELMNSAGQYDFALRYGERFFSDVLGVQATGNLERRIRSNERINIDYGFGGRGYGINNFIVEFTDEIRTRRGGGLLLDINTPDEGVIRVNNIYSSTKRDYLFSNRNYPYASGLLLQYTARNREQEIGTFTSSVTGDNFLYGLEATWGLSFAQSDAKYPYDYSIDFIEPSIIQNGVQISGMRNDTPSLQSAPERLIPFALNNFAVAYLNNAYYRSEKNRDKERTAFLNLLTPYTITSGISGELKIGGKYKDKGRFKASSELYSPYYLGYWRAYTRLPDGSIQPKNFTGTWFQPFYDRFIQTSGATRNPFASDFLDTPPHMRNLLDLYQLSPIVNRDALRLWYELNKNGVDNLGRSLEYYTNPAIDADFYDVTERVSAAYLMNTLNIGQDITFIAGVRVEHERNDYRSRFSPGGLGGFPVPSGVVRDTSSSYNETLWLPNVQLLVRPTDFLNIRAAAYRAVARPDFNLRLQKFVSSGGGGDVRLLLGNTGLKTAKAWNYEINTSVFGNSIGLVSVSFFYKEITDLFHVLDSVYTVGNALIDTFGVAWRTPHTGSYALTIPYNSFKPTKVWGFEFEHQMNFNFLPGFFKNFVLSYNFSVVRSETFLVSVDTATVYRKVYVPGFDSILVPFTTNEIVETKQKLEGQPEFYGNIAVGYDVGGFSARLSLFHQGEYNQSFSGSGTNDVVVDAFTRLDLALRQQITPNIEILMNVNNLTNIEERTSAVNREAGLKLPNTRELYGRSADLGVRLLW